jgi:starch phosphorylase
MRSEENYSHGPRHDPSESVYALKQSYQHHLTHSLAQDRSTETPRGSYSSLALAVRDQLIPRWLRTQQAYLEADAKRVYYLSLEFLLGRMLGNNLINLQRFDETAQALRDLGYRLEDLRELE